MNREERRRENKINRKERKESFIEDVVCIDDELDITENLIEKASKNIVTVNVPKNVRKLYRNCSERLENYRKNFRDIREVFCNNETGDDGFVKKGVINALEIPMYKENLDKCVENVRKNKRKGICGEFDYLMFHDLSANKIEVRRTLNVLEKALPVMIANLKANNITENLEFLLAELVKLEKRLYQLFCLYGHYLIDTGNELEYHLMGILFYKFDTTFEDLIDIFD